MVGVGIFATKMGETYSRVWVGAWLLGGFAATAALRVAVRSLLRSLRVRGLNQRHVAIVGAGTLGRTGRDAACGSHPGRILDLPLLRRRRALVGTAVAIGSHDDRPSTFFPMSPAGHVDQAVARASPARGSPHPAASSPCCATTPSKCASCPTSTASTCLNHSVTEVAGLPVISLTEPPMSGINRVVKAIEDYALATVLARARSRRSCSRSRSASGFRRKARALPPAAGDVERRSVRDAQVPHHAR
jgi:putative colanic acid biosynthesis UDP-glucose lipid carrier transferase